MYIEKVFVYLVMGLLALLILRMMRIDLKVYQMERILKALGQHERDVDNTVKSLICIMETFFEGLKENARANKERENARREQQKERDRKDKGK